MKVSIVLPIYNGEETLKGCLDAIADINYPKEDFELIVVNDGSKDSTDDIVKEFVDKRVDDINVKYFNLKKNVGRIKARLKGVEESNFDNLLFIDHRGQVEKDIIKEIKKKDYQPIIGNLYQNKKESLIGNFFYVLRRIIYHPYWGENFDDVYISEENFDQIAKGFCPFYCKKELLLRNLPEKKGKNISDDTLVFSNIVREKDILKTSECKVEYSERNIGEDFFEHLFNRAPKFVHFYFPKSFKYKSLIFLIALSPFILASIITALIVLPELLYVLTGLILILSSFLIIKYKVSILDIFVFFILLPVITFVFAFGLWKGLFLKISKRFD